MATKAKYNAGFLQYYDSTTDEYYGVQSPVQYREEFFRLDGNTWTSIDVSAAGNTIPAIITSSKNGVVRIPLDNTNEAQESGLTWGNHRCFVLNQNLALDMRLALHTLPTGSVTAVWGLAGNYNAAPNSVAESIWFRVDGSGAVTVETDDTVNETSQVATGVTLIADVFHQFRIDCAMPASVKFYIDGVRVAAGTIFDLSTVPALLLQPYVHISKNAASSVGTIDLDCLRMWQNRG